MPEAKIRARGGAKRWRTKRLRGGKYIHIAVVPKAGPRGGHTIAGPEHTVQKTRRRRKRRRG